MTPKRASTRRRLLCSVDSVLCHNVMRAAEMTKVALVTSIKPNALPDWPGSTARPDAALQLINLNRGRL